MAVVEVCSAHHNTARLAPQAIATVAELTMHFVRCSLVPNLQAFSNHASRRRITEQDVLLTVRNHREFQRKIQQKIEHFRRTNDILGTTTTTDVVNSKRHLAPPDRPIAEEVPSSNSSCSSTDSEPPEPGKAPAVAAKRSDRPRFDDFFSSDDDDELNAMRAKLVRKKPKRAIAMANPTTKTAVKASVSRRATFRLGNTEAATTDLLLETRRDGSNTSPLPATGTWQTQSRRLQEILLENQDDESLPSDCD
jgi:hypothetical protein